MTRKFLAGKSSLPSLFMEKKKQSDTLAREVRPESRFQKPKSDVFQVKGSKPHGACGTIHTLFASSSPNICQPAGMNFDSP